MRSINSTFLEPFQTLEASPLPLSLVSSANRHCKFYSTSTPEVLRLTGIIISFISLVALFDARVILGANHIGVQRWFASSTCNEALHISLLYGPYSPIRVLYLMKQRGSLSAEDTKQ
jgi:hypothetical protein